MYVAPSTESGCFNSDTKTSANHLTLIMAKTSANHLTLINIYYCMTGRAIWGNIQFSGYVLSLPTATLELNIIYLLYDFERRCHGNTF